MTEREIKQLMKLLSKLRVSKATSRSVDFGKDAGEDYFSAGERSIIATVEKWAAWYGHDELSMDKIG